MFPLSQGTAGDPRPLRGARDGSGFSPRAALLPGTLMAAGRGPSPPVPPMWDPWGWRVVVGGCATPSRAALLAQALLQEVPGLLHLPENPHGVAPQSPQPSQNKKASGTTAWAGASHEGPRLPVPSLLHLHPQTHPLWPCPEAASMVSSTPRHTMRDPGTTLSPLVPITVTCLPLRPPRQTPVPQPARGSPACA